MAHSTSYRAPIFPCSRSIVRCSPKSQISYGSTLCLCGPRLPGVHGEITPLQRAIESRTKDRIMAERMLAGHWELSFVRLGILLEVRCSTCCPGPLKKVVTLAVNVGADWQYGVIRAQSPGAWKAFLPPSTLLCCINSYDQASSCLKTHICTTDQVLPDHSDRH